MSNVTHPSHYNSGKIEVIEAIEDWKLNFHRGNAVKYTARAGKKDASKEIEDLEKAVWYLNREIETLKATRDNRSPTRPNDMNPRSTSATDVSNSNPQEKLADIAKSVKDDPKYEVCGSCYRECQDHPTNTCSFSHSGIWNR